MNASIKLYELVGFLWLLVVSINALPFVNFTNLMTVPEISYPSNLVAQLVEFSPFQAKTWLPSFPSIGWWGLNKYYDDYSIIYLSQDVISKTKPADSNLELWLQRQNEIAFQSILNNIGGIGLDFQNDSQVAPGAVIASPSKITPNYFYQWIRDAAITIQSLIDFLEDHDFEEEGFPLIEAIELYIINSYKLQRLDNQSGSWNSLNGLGEPKFLVNSTSFDEPWGRPQRDGPGLRVITITNYLKLLNKYDQQVFHKKLKSCEWVYNNIVKPDLNYIISNWFNTGFDLWEEIDSLHLFTSLTQLKALQSGLEISEIIDNNKEDDNERKFQFKLKQAFQQLRFFIVMDSGYKISSIPYLIETPSLVVQGKRSGLDIASVLASLRSHDLNANDSQQIPFPIEDSAVWSTLVALINDMKYRYPINHKRLGNISGVALGRYPEDKYDGYQITEGNPWFIATATASELIYKIIYHLYNTRSYFEFTRDQGLILGEITNIRFPAKVSKIRIPFGSEAFNEVALGFLNYGDSFLDVIKEHVDGEGHMSEQFNKYNGYMEGAEDLTWSYGSFWSALRWRGKVLELLGD